ncbi:ABC transporter substrate-binding protein [Agathobaculum sp. NSJ-28]|uniref:ABC transporter substrate-binding protein n=2 Tax=Agathobaculum TaxID=2048137 RepID=A0A923LTC7_9FIRM|nr:MULTISPECIES: ABC transporter substrate-binding protein [Agathobaculum]MBC5724946.1 ABC transporter substrate-binding protein [Agathobaculum faecis]MCU6788389.1 ABC transporter substrate-binding protein [Agathobaculum ammoniilyticum]SCI71961.1 ABC-type Fe3+-citrate transport system%2C periplasmic component [uncultured Butyricicoccus sp.]
MKRHGMAAAILSLAVLLAACSPASEPVSGEPSAVSWDSLTVESGLDLQYADQFTVDYYTGGYALIHIVDGNDYLVVPENKPVPDGLADTTVVLTQPLDHIYLVATSAMDLFCALDGIGSIRLSGTDERGWYIDEAKAAMQNGAMLYAGKYSAPDYELIYAEQCDLAVESTMIYHSPEVKEQLERLGVPVLVERSSYESSPLGRMEWLKLYGVLLNREEAAEAIYQQALDSLRPVIEQENTGKAVVFFYINSNGSANVRKSNDYVAKMIEMAGGTYIFSDLGNDNALSTMNMQMEMFYTGAKDADVIIYNSTIDGELHSIDELLAKSPLLADFKAVRNGDVWCTGQNLFQSTMGLGDMILDIHAVLTEEAPEPLTYLHRLT